MAKEQKLDDSLQSSEATMRPGDQAPAGTPGSGEAVCPDCSGSGKKDGKPCENCSGAGIVIAGVGGG
ncbi:MAG: hypothetical protein JWP00_2911 [Chloroflexi bacterium]|jgi:hypothetical protein|nr:hypothetical protein [Chloroflexota bacterium]